MAQYPQPAKATTIIHNVQSVNVGPNPTRLTCPSCHADVVTKISHEATTRTHIMALVLCLFLCWPCVCVPYCTDSCRNADHSCPNCGAFIGTYKS